MRPALWSGQARGGTAADEDPEPELPRRPGEGIFRATNRRQCRVRPIPNPRPRRKRQPNGKPQLAAADLTGKTIAIFGLGDQKKYAHEFVDAIGILIGLLILQVPLAFPLAVLTFLLAFIPFVGATLAGTLAALVSLVVFRAVRARRNHAASGCGCSSGCAGCSGCPSATGGANGRAR